MPKSWLADAKTIYDIGAPDYVRKWSEWDDAKEIKREDRASEKWLTRLRQPTQVDVAYKKFFGSRMHDSWVMDIVREGDSLIVRLDCIHADIFALSLSSNMGIDPVPSQWPVDLVLHDVGYVRASHSDAAGALRHANWESLKSVTPQQGPCFLYDWFFEQEGRLQWIAQITGDHRRRGWLSSEIYLMVDCSRATAIDHRSRAIERAYGPLVRELWDDARAHEGDIWAMPLMKDFLLKRMSERGLDPSDLRPANLETPL